MFAKLFSKLRLSQLADIASVLSITASIVPLPPGAEPYRVLINILMLFAVAWLSRFVLRWFAKEKQPRPSSEPPGLLVVGSPDDQILMREICEHPLVTQDPYITFSAVTIEPGVATPLPERDGYIVLPTITRKMAAEIINELEHRSRGTTPVGRLYPAGYAGHKLVDFPVIPFQDPTGIVNYASEFLFKRAIVMGRQMRARYVWTLRLFIISLGVLGMLYLKNVRELHQAQGDNQILQKLLAPSQTTQQATVESSNEYRHTAQNDSPANPAATRKVLATWAETTVDTISRAFKNSWPKRLYIYVLSKREQQLIPIARHGASSYPLHPVNSIAGCAMQYRLAVYWKGMEDETNEIRAWNLNGTPIGKYDEKQKRLLLPQASCSFQSTGQKDPKVELLCVPIAADDSETSPDVPGVVCISVDKETHFMTNEWLRHFLGSASNTLGFFNLEALTQPPQTKAARTAVGQRSSN